MVAVFSAGLALFGMIVVSLVASLALWSPAAAVVVIVMLTASARKPVMAGHDELPGHSAREAGS